MINNDMAVFVECAVVFFIAGIVAGHMLFHKKHKKP